MGTIAENAFAYSKNQASTGTNACGNGEAPTNIGCQNTDSQIQGNENFVAITAQQTFPAVVREEPPTPPPTLTCVECFGLLTTEHFGSITDNLGIANEEDICALLDAGTLTVADIEEAASDEEIADQDDVISFLDCIRAIFGGA